MITGVVKAAREAAIPLTVRGPQGQEQQVQAIVDTGFTGARTLPPTLIAALSLSHRGRGRGILADGSGFLFDIYEATVVWDG
ncbi:MAG: clan AA aspartic protease, partial [Chloroflexota bacterium]